MWRRSIPGSVAGLTWMVVALAGCGIAETKLPPEPTVEYLPCSGMNLSRADRDDPLTVLQSQVPDLESSWGGSWTVGEELHIALTDVGAVDWEAACARIGESELVVHEVPFPLTDLETWADDIDDRIAAGDLTGTGSQELVIIAGQYVIEIRAGTVEDAALIAGDVPLDAWAYGGSPSS
jgi:hypothetical protein